jgi:hypothetical protein
VFCILQIRCSLGEPKNGKGQEVHGGQCLYKPCIISDQPPDAGDPAERTLHHPTAWQQDEAFPGFRRFDDLLLDAMCVGRLLGCIADVTLLHKGYFDALSGCLLYNLQVCCFGSPYSFAGVTKRARREPMVSHHHMGLAAPTAFVAIITGTGTVLDVGLQHASIEDGGAGLRLALLGFPQQDS